VRLYNVTFDARDPRALATFWSAVLERRVADGSNDFAAFLEGTPNWIFIAVPEEKTAKNRMHVDLDADDLTAARDRLVALGATYMHEQEQYGLHWMTFQDPEGNEFCVASHA
jgi:predicted enzyme related to lactoylglutathione lyase